MFIGRVGKMSWFLELTKSQKVITIETFEMFYKKKWFAKYFTKNIKTGSKIMKIKEVTKNLEKLPQQNWILFPEKETLQ